MYLGRLVQRPKNILRDILIENIIHFRQANKELLYMLCAKMRRAWLAEV